MTESRLPAGLFYGTTIDRRETSGLSMSDCRYNPGLRTPVHSHERPYVNLVLRGSYTETSGRLQRECGSLSFVLHPAGEVHSDQFHRGGGRVFSVEISPAWETRIDGIHRVLQSPQQQEGGEAAWLALRLYEEFRLSDSLTPLSAEGLALQMLAECDRRRATPRGLAGSRWLEPVRELLHARFTESITLDEMAVVCGRHPLSVARAFRQRFGCTAGEYARKLRVEKAAHVLSTTMSPISQIASSVGYSDASQFIHVFERHVGVTPARFRRLVRSR